MLCILSWRRFWVCQCSVLAIKTLTVWIHHDSNQYSVKMTSLSAKDKDRVRAFWAKIAPKTEDIGAEALAR